MHGHGDVDAILRRIKEEWGEELRAAVLDRSFHLPLDGRVRAEFLQWAASLRQEAVYDVLASQRDLDLTGRLVAVRQPVIVVHGRHDRARPPRQGLELARSLPNAEFRLVEAGHTPVYETPGAVADAVRVLLTRIQPTSSRLGSAPEERQDRDGAHRTAGHREPSLTGCSASISRTRGTTRVP